MDLNETIVQLRAERDKLEAVLKQLVALDGTGGKPRSPRGRKFMDEAERREVSVRMKRYWASRRKAKG